MKVWKLKDIHYNYQTLCILTKKGSITTITSPKHPCLQEIINFCHWMVLYLQYFYEHKCIFLKLSHIIDCTGHVEGSCIGNDISITSANFNHQNCKSSCIYQVLKFQISHLIVTLEFTPFRGSLQLDHSVTRENIKCY